MRRAHQDAGWVQDAANGHTGVCLGFDFCAEHEWGTEFFYENLGIAQMDCPLGVEDRQQTEVPDDLVFLEYADRPTDKRRKSTQPAALLYCARIWNPEHVNAMSPKKRAQHFAADFYRDWDANSTTPGADFVSAWDGRNGFVLHVRGAENVARLKELHQALLAKDIALAPPAAVGFNRRGPCLIQVSRLSQEVKDSVRAKDEGHKRLLDAAEATGVAAALTAAGKQWYALSPRWRYGPGSEVLFFLNPQGQRRYASGWFTREELLDWAKDQGPVVDTQEIEAKLKATDPAWGIHLLRGVNAQGMHMNAHERFVWLDAQKTQIGVRLLMSKDNVCKKLTDGTYPLDAVQEYIEAGRALEAVAT